MKAVIQEQRPQSSAISEEANGEKEEDEEEEEEERGETGELSSEASPPVPSSSVGSPSGKAIIVPMSIVTTRNDTVSPGDKTPGEEGGQRRKE